MYGSNLICLSEFGLSFVTKLRVLFSVCFLNYESDGVSILIKVQSVTSV